MSTFRIALANIQFPATPQDSVTLAEQAIAQASTEGAGLICFVERREIAAGGLQSSPALDGDRAFIGSARGVHAVRLVP